MALLHRAHLAPDSKASADRRALARNAMDAVSKEFVFESKNLLNRNRLPFHTTSPLALHWGYQAAIHLAWLTQIEPQPWIASALDTVQNTLREANTRWKVAGAITLPMRFFQQFPDDSLWHYRILPRHFGSATSRTGREQ
jgi:hypothetical protein